MNDQQFIRDTIRDYLPEAKIYAFGSRVQDNEKKFSDFDVAIDNHGSIELSQLSAIQEIFDESNLPYKVDMTDFHRVSSEFRTIILSTETII